MNGFTNVIKKVLGAMLCFSVLCAMGISTFAYTSDQVILSRKTPGAGYVTSTTGLYVRNEASTDSMKVASLAYNEQVTIIERVNNSWYKIRYGSNGAEGYASRNYIREYDLNWYCTVSTGGKILYLRNGAGQSYGVAANIPNGTSVPELTYTGKWDYVLYGSKDGYISLDYANRFHY